VTAFLDPEAFELAAAPDNSIGSPGPEKRVNVLLKLDYDLF
jgi:hypothetical protein